MATKAKAGKMVGTTAAAAADDTPQAPTRCDQAGDDIGGSIISLHRGEPVDLHLLLCKAAFDVRVFLDDEVIADKDEAKDEILVTLPPLDAGTHRLTWGYIAAGTPWQVVSEVSVSGVPRFRRLKADPGSTFASNNLVVFFEVLS